MSVRSDSRNEVPWRHRIQFEFDVSANRQDVSLGLQGGMPKIDFST